MIARLIKVNKKIAAIILLPVLILLVAFTLIACDNDLNYDEAIAIAKRDFGCEKVLWIDTYSGALNLNPGEEKMPVKMRSHYAYYIVGEKAGKEVYIMIPSDPTLEKAYATRWNLDYTFKQIVEKFNEHDANYKIEVPDDYYNVKRNYIEFIGGEERISRLATYYDVENAETFYERLDVKTVFSYSWQDDESLHDCIVFQIDGELLSYEKTRAA